MLHNFLPKQVTSFSFILKYKNEKYFSDLQLFISLQCVNIFLNVLHDIYYFVHGEKNWHGLHECGEGSHTYNQGKNSIMVVSKVPLSTYRPDLDERKKDHMQRQVSFWICSWCKFVKTHWHYICVLFPSHLEWYHICTSWNTMHTHNGCS